MGGTGGSIVNLTMVFFGICIATIALVQMIASAVNQSLREREIARDGPDIPLLTWSQSLQLGSKIFAEALLTFLIIWLIEIAGLWLLAGGAPSLEFPSIDPDNVSLGTILYGLECLAPLRCVGDDSLHHRSDPQAIMNPVDEFEVLQSHFRPMALQVIATS